MSLPRYAIFVDAGYVFGQGALSFSISGLGRSQLRLNEAEIINQLKSITARPSAELLRVYWYDGTRGNMTAEQTTLAEMPDVKMRLGYINTAGQQKGVDSLIVTDLIELARNQAIGDAYLVSGDGDLRVGVQIAQSFGVRVHLINLEPSNSSLNPQLRQEADTRHEIPKAEVVKFLSVQEAHATTISFIAAADGGSAHVMPAAPALEIGNATKQAIKAVFADVPSAEIAKLKALRTGVTIPSEYDRKILGTARALLGRDLTNSERAIMRKFVLEWLRQP